ncbi:MAG: insulinase family protein [Gammaproteobacteria bacterium]|nr:insulinase family protein [Gammaproteobacteria bacterium]
MRRLIYAVVCLALAGCASTDNMPVTKSLAGASGSATADYSVYLDRPPLLPQYQRVVLDNGIVLLLLEKPEVPLVGFEAIIRGGAVADPAGKAGTASLLAELLRKGAGGRSAAEFAESVEGLGGALNTGAGLENMAVSGSFLSKDAATGVGLLADLLMRPALDEAEFIKLQVRAAQYIKAAKDGSPSRLLGTYAGAFLFGDHPYGRPSFGSEASLAAITLQDVRSYYRDHIGADRLILAVAGDFDAAEMTALLRDAFGGWRRAAASLPEYSSAERVAGGRVLLIDKPDATQTYFWMGNVGVSKYYPQRASLALTNTVFGGRFTSMLNTALRVESGLTYGASSRLSRPREAGSISISSFTATETTAQAIDLALDVLDRLHRDGLDDAALASAKAYVLGQFPLAFETGPQLARQIGQLEFFNLDNAYINAYPQELVLADLSGTKAVVESVFPARDDLVFVLIGNAAAIRDEVARYGTVTEMDITQTSFTPR